MSINQHLYMNIKKLEQMVQKFAEIFESNKHQYLPSDDNILVTINSVPDKNTISVLRWLRELTGFGLTDAIRLRKHILLQGKTTVKVVKQNYSEPNMSYTGNWSDDEKTRTSTDVVESIQQLRNLGCDVQIEENNSTYDGAYLFIPESSIEA